MRNKLLYTTIVTAALAIGSAGCGKGYFELYDNPSQVSTPTMPTLLSTVTHKAAMNTYSVGSTVSYYTQYLASPSAASPTDIYQELDLGGTWDAIYYALADTKDLLELAKQANSSMYEGVASFLIAYNLTLANDIWGTVPWTDIADPNILYPKYDDDKAIYDTCLAYINIAIDKFANPSTGNATYAVNNDMIYHGATKTEAAAKAFWLKASYALKARLLIKVSKTSAYNPAEILNIVGSSLASNNDNVGMANFQLRNNWATVARSNAAATLGGWLSEQFIDHMNGTTYGIFDPRLPKITDTALGGIYIGTENGAGNRPPGNNITKDECYVSLNSPLTNETAPIQLITYSELKFIEAEAALNTDPTRAYNAYLEGIRAHFDLLGVSTTDRDDYLAEPTVGVGAGNLTIDHIMKEKYVVMYLNPAAWADARRYNYQYKDFTLPENAEVNQFIRRQQYPRSEFAENGQNAPRGVVVTDRLWWDQ